MQPHAPASVCAVRNAKPGLPWGPTLPCSDRRQRAAISMLPAVRHETPNDAWQRQDCVGSRASDLSADMSIPPPFSSREITRSHRLDCQLAGPCTTGRRDRRVTIPVRAGYLRRAVIKRGSERPPPGPLPLPLAVLPHIPVLAAYSSHVPLRSGHARASLIEITKRDLGSALLLSCLLPRSYWRASTHPGASFVIRVEGAKRHGPSSSGVGV